MPDARGEAEVTPNDGATRINLHFDHLSNPIQFGSEYLTLVLWGITPEGRPERLGEVTLRNADNHSAELACDDRSGIVRNDRDRRTLFFGEPPIGRCRDGEFRSRRYDRHDAGCRREV